LLLGISVATPGSERGFIVAIIPVRRRVLSRRKSGDFRYTVAMATTPDWPDIPEYAVSMFERLHRLRVTVHDLRGTLWPFLRPDRFQHAQPECQAIKMQSGNSDCLRFEIQDTRRDLAALPEGRVHICHAGLVEWAVPVFREGRLEWLLFAGVRTPGLSLRPGYRAPRIHRAELLPVPVRPAPVEDDEAAIVLEHLRQLAARLDVWRQPGYGSGGTKGNTAAGDLFASRRTRILRFVQARHTDSGICLTDLAHTLDLSVSRTGHAVREACGTTFPALLAEARLRTAAGLLRHSALSVLEVAAASGFADPSRFHRHFKRTFGTTPHRYRHEAQV
jgi:AraC-like DNA-binding protein